MLVRAASLVLLAAIACAPATSAQQRVPAQTPEIGRLEIRAYQAIPRVKTAVQLSSDTHLARELRRLVMIRIARRGNEVGFSGGNVMRMDVSFRDFGLEPGTRGSAAGPAGETTLRITLTLYTLDGGRVLWQATAACRTGDAQALRVGEIMIDAIFENADRSRIADAGCPV